MQRVIALAVGYALDLLIGDPGWIPHPIVGIGRMIALAEKACRRLFPATPGWEVAAGAAVVAVVLAVSGGVAFGVVHAAGLLHPWLRVALEAWICCQLLAAKSLRAAAMHVHGFLAAGDVPGARLAVARIVGRDTTALDAAGVARATVETVAENSSDGVIAPMLFFAIGGAPLAVLYKAINTMDSMLGYKNDKYLYFGRVAARLDDVANFLPARLTALFMIPAAALARLDWKNAARILRRDGGNHTSPNAGRPEAACAGALGVRLGGASVYGGVTVDKPGIGDAFRGIEAGDISRACRLMYWTAFLCFVICCAGIALAKHCIDGAGAWI